MNHFFFKNFTPSKSFPNNLTIKLTGVKTIKYTKNMTIGEIIIPKTSPNLIHILLSGDNNLELIKPRIKKVIEIAIK